MKATSSNATPTTWASMIPARKWVKYTLSPRAPWATRRAAATHIRRRMSLGAPVAASRTRVATAHPPSSRPLAPWVSTTLSSENPNRGVPGLPL
ncbi:MAG: hypothetical protein M0Z82_00220 [Actinomycetota bacterium]|nr:hypothetical protein [Actinomycetota bacterium]